MFALTERLGKKGAALYYAYRVLAALGKYSSLRSVEWSRVDRVVFVCTGNVCRSPYAQYKLRVPGVTAASCGTAAIHGAAANADAVRIAQVRGVDLRAHASVPAHDFIYGPHDLIVALEPAHLRDITAHVAQVRCQATLLGLWCDAATAYIPDPFGRSDACFGEVFRLIDEAIGTLASELRSCHESPQAQLP